MKLLRKPVTARARGIPRTATGLHCGGEVIYSKSRLNGNPLEARFLDTYMSGC